MPNPISDDDRHAIEVRLGEIRKGAARAEKALRYYMDYRVVSEINTIAIHLGVIQLYLEPKKEGS